jgi:hypothetical protein
MEDSIVGRPTSTQGRVNIPEETCHEASGIGRVSALVDLELGAYVLTEALQFNTSLVAYAYTCSFDEERTSAH